MKQIEKPIKLILTKEQRIKSLYDLGERNATHIWRKIEKFCKQKLQRKVHKIQQNQRVSSKMNGILQVKVYNPARNKVPDFVSMGNSPKDESTSDIIFYGETQKQIKFSDNKIYSAWCDSKGQIIALKQKGCSAWVILKHCFTEGRQPTLRVINKFYKKSQENDQNEEKIETRGRKQISNKQEQSTNRVNSIMEIEEINIPIDTRVTVLYQSGIKKPNTIHDKVAPFSDLSLRTIQRKVEKLKKGEPIKKQYVRAPTTMTEEVKEQIREVVDQDNVFTISDIQKEGEVNASKYSIWNFLTNEEDYEYKKTVQKPLLTRAHIDNCIQFSLKYKNSKNIVKQGLFCDETIFIVIKHLPINGSTKMNR
ncbi:hypothetical protein ABPG72_021748 [Tetrahymena utriculariae]